MHPFDASEEKELSLAKGDFVVVRKVGFLVTICVCVCVCVFHVNFLQSVTILTNTLSSLTRPLENLAVKCT